VTLREDIDGGLRRAVAWLLLPPADPELWPDERLRLLELLDHLDGVRRRPPERGGGGDVRLAIPGERVLFVPRHVPGHRFGVCLRPTGSQLVRHARWTSVLLRSLPDRGVELPEEIRDLLVRLERAADAAASIAGLGGEVV